MRDLTSNEVLEEEYEEAKPYVQHVIKSKQREIFMTNVIDLDNIKTEAEVWELMKVLHDKMEALKPAERSQHARRFAIALTDYERSMCVYHGMVMSDGPKQIVYAGPIGGK